jgi:molybdopterin-guanine dinucleotide biosynthesis protein B
MKVLGLAGWSGAGKTTLLSKLIPILIGRGLSVSIVKHAHHDFDVDQPGKDSYRLRAAGAGEVIVSSARRWALMHELGDAAEPDLATLLRRLSPCDLVVVEGFKRGRHPKLEIFRTANGRAPLHPEDARIVAIASDSPFPGAGAPVVSLDDIEAIADLVLARAAPIADVLSQLEDHGPA